MKVCICGPRDYTDYTTLLKAIKKFGYAITEVVSGCANGVDSLGERYARENNIPIKRFPADWNNLKQPGAIIKKNKAGERYNANAGFYRSVEMVKYADAVLAIKKGFTPGTAFTISACERANKNLFVYDVDEDS